MNARLLSAALSLALGACVWGGPSGDPSALQPLPEPSGGAAGGPSHATGGVASAGVGGLASGGGGGLAPAGGAGLASTGGMASDDEGGAFQGSPDDPTCSPSVPICDPVHNQGCSASLQCDVDPLQLQTPTGRCVFRDTSATGPCASTLVSQSCEPGNTCVESVCRRLCHCDLDCAAGQCCKPASGAAGFELCEPCP